MDTTPGLSRNREIILENVLADVKRNILVAWERGKDPVAVVLRDRNGVLETVWIPFSQETLLLAAQPTPVERPLSDPMEETVAEDEVEIGDITPLDKTILGVLDDASGPIKLVNIARRASHDNDSYFKSRMRYLVQKGLARKVDEVYYERA